MTVTMAVSTVSVVESIVVMRLCSLQSSTAMPSVVRLVAFRLVGRALRVTSRPPTSPPPVADRRRRRSAGDHETPERQTDPDERVKESLLGDMEMSASVTAAGRSSELLVSVKNVLTELRKVA